jgi:hypothetical protein
VRHLYTQTIFGDSGFGVDRRLFEREEGFFDLVGRALREAKFTPGHLALLLDITLALRSQVLVNPSDFWQIPFLLHGPDKSPLIVIWESSIPS